MASSKFVLFSYHKNYQEFVLKIYDYLKRENVPVLIDIHDDITKDTYRNNGIGVLVCFITPMYQASKDCQEQVKTARNERIPVIAISFLPNWKPSGWLNQIRNHLYLIDFRGINENNFPNKISQLREKIIWLLENNSKLQRINESSVQDEDLLERSISLNDSNAFPMVESVNIDCSKKKSPLKYRLLPENCRVHLSNLVICNNEYILIYGNYHFHLFDKNLRLIRSNNELKIDQNDLKDFSWCSDLNHFLILTKKRVYFLNPLTCKPSLVENLKLRDQREEFVTFCCSPVKLFVITCQIPSNTYYLEEYSLPSFCFLRKYSMIDLIEIHLLIQNGFNQNHLEQIISIKYSQQKLAIIMKISFQWFIYVFHLYEQPIFFMKIPLEDQSRMAILNPMNQWIIYKENLSNSFVQISMNFHNPSPRFNQYSRGFIDFNGKLRSVASLGTLNLVLLLDDALVIYKI